MRNSFGIVMSLQIIFTIKGSEEVQECAQLPPLKVVTKTLQPGCRVTQNRNEKLLQESLPSEVNDSCE